MSGFLIEPKPVLAVEFEDIDIAIRRERARVQDVEFDTGVAPVSGVLNYMLAEKARGVQQWVVNL